MQYPNVQFWGLTYGVIIKHTYWSFLQRLISMSKSWQRHVENLLIIQRLYNLNTIKINPSKLWWRSVVTEIYSDQNTEEVIFNSIEFIIAFISQFYFMNSYYQIANSVLTSNNDFNIYLYVVIFACCCLHYIILMIAL